MVMIFEIPYGQSKVKCSLPWGTCRGVLNIAPVESLQEPKRAVRQAVEHPIGLIAPLPKLLKPSDTVAMIVSDVFRETGADLMVPVIAETLNQAGVRDEAITIVFATGSHRAPTQKEQEHILGSETYARFRSRIVHHTPAAPASLAYIGTTTRGTPVYINKQVHDSSLIIATGNVVFHYFAGFGGGRKAIVPGVAGIETISHNHALNLDCDGSELNPDVRIGVLEGNPVAEDLLEAARMAGPVFVVNTVMNQAGKIAAVFAGELDAAHQAAVDCARRVFAVDIAQQADFVIAASPTTRNFVQTHKALFNAYQAVKPDGRIILLAPCPEGLGGEQFLKWLRLPDREAIIAGLRRQCEINGQTALSTIQKGPMTCLVSEINEHDAQLLRMKKASSLDSALETVHDDLIKAEISNPTFYLMPNAAYTVPFLQNVVSWPSRP